MSPFVSPHRMSGRPLPSMSAAQSQWSTRPEWAVPPLAKGCAWMAESELRRDSVTNTGDFMVRSDVRGWLSPALSGFCQARPLHRTAAADRVSDQRPYSVRLRTDDPALPSGGPQI